VVDAVQIQRRECRQLLTNGQHQLYFLPEGIPGFTYIEFDHWANHCGKYPDRLYNCWIDDKDSNIPSLLIMFTCIALRHALLVWQKNKGVSLKASKSNLKADRPDCSNYLNYKNDSHRIASCCAATGRKVLTSPGIADMNTFSMNTWNTLPESYQQRVYTYTPATVERQIQQANNSMPTEFRSTEAAGIDNAIRLDYLTSDVALEEPGIGSTDLKIPIDNDCMDQELHFGMPRSCEDHDDDGDDMDQSDAIQTDSRQ